MPIKAKITTRSLKADVSSNQVNAAVSSRRVKANISTNKIDAKVTTINVKANVTTNKVVANVQYIGGDTQLAAGLVKPCTLGDATIYRFINDTFVGLYPSEDSFYSDFDGINLTNLLATRG